MLIKFKFQQPLIVMILEHNYKLDSRIIKEIYFLTNHGYNILLIYRDINIKEFKIDYINESAYAFNILNPDYIYNLINFFKYINPIAIHCHDYYNIPYGLFIKKKTGIPVIYDSHELWGFTANIRWFENKIIRLLDTYYLKKADYIIFVNEFIKRFQEKKIKLNNNRIFIVRNSSYYIENIKPLLKKRYPFLKNKQIIIYSGGVRKHRHIENIILSASILEKKRDDIAFVFLGGENYIDFLKEIMNPLPNNVYIIPSVPTNEIIPMVADANIGICFLDTRILNYFYSSATKTMEYLMAEVPGLYSKGPFYNMFEKKGVGFVLENISPESIAHKIEELLNNKEVLKKTKERCKIIKKDICFDKDGINLLKIYDNLKNNNDGVKEIKFAFFNKSKLKTKNIKNKKILILRTMPLKRFLEILDFFDDSNKITVWVQDSFDDNIIKRKNIKIEHILNDGLFMLKTLKKRYKAIKRNNYDILIILGDDTISIRNIYILSLFINSKEVYRIYSNFKMKKQTLFSYLYYLLLPYQDILFRIIRNIKLFLKVI